MERKLVVNWPYSGVFSCGVSAAATFRKLSYYEEFYRTPGSRRVRPAPENLCWSPTALQVKSRSIVDDGWLTTVRHNNPWHTCMGNGSITYSRPIYDHAGDGMIPQYPTQFPSISDTELLLALKDEQVNLGVFVAEAKETGLMFRNLALSTIGLYRRIRHGRPGKLKRILQSGIRSAPDTWMLYRYGLTPLYHDLHGLKKLHDAMFNESVVRRIELKRKLTSETRQGPWILSDSSVVDPNMGYVIRRDTCRTKRVAYVEYKTHMAANMAGLSNLLSVGYEVIPYSFVLDHVINIGDYLAAIDALDNVIRYSSVTITKGTREEIWPKGGTTGRARIYSRTVDGPLVNHFPSWDPSGSWKHVVDSLVLLRNLRRSFS